MHLLPCLDELVEVLGSGFQYLFHISSFSSRRFNVTQLDRSIAEKVYDHDDARELAVRVSRIVIFGIKPKANTADPTELTVPS